MASSTQGSPVKALLVEDEEIHIFIMSTFLRRFNCETTVAKNGKEAVDIFLEGNKFDIVLCNKKMPVMAGPEAVEKIRAMGETDVLIVGVSADYDAGEEFFNAGADVFVGKPMKPDVLEKMIQKAINKKKNTRV
ncbi:unnamed protein product [Alopecurus aequalis]